MATPKKRHSLRRWLVLLTIANTHNVVRGPARRGGARAPCKRTHLGANEVLVELEAPVEEVKDVSKKAQVLALAQHQHKLVHE